MFDRLEDRIPNKFQIITHYTKERLWYDSEEVYANDVERVVDYIVKSDQLDKLRQVGFYPHTNTVKLAFNYHMKKPRAYDVRLFHTRAFVKPPIGLLKLLYKHAKAEVHEFILNCTDKYNVKELPYDDGTWLMSIVLGAKD